MAQEARSEVQAPECCCHCGGMYLHAVGCDLKPAPRVRGRPRKYPRAERRRKWPMWRETVPQEFLDWIRSPAPAFAII